MHEWRLVGIEKFNLQEKERLKCNNNNNEGLLVDELQNDNKMKSMKLFCYLKDMLTKNINKMVENSKCWNIQNNSDSNAIYSNNNGTFTIVK